jgi:hypothetical protein
MRHQYNLDPPKSIFRRMWLLIDRFIRAHKTISIAFVVALLLIVTFAVKNTHSVPICRSQPEIEIVNESSGESRELSRQKINSSTIKQDTTVHFQQYVTNVSQIFSRRISHISPCKQVANAKPQVKLIFVYRPLTSDGIAPFDFERHKRDPVRPLDSPWVKIAINKSPNPFIQAVFIWSARQYLLDQALLSGMSASSTKSPLPLELDTFINYGDKHFEMYGSMGISRTPAKLAAVEATLARLLPADILWLFDDSLVTRNNMMEDGSIRATEFDLEQIGHGGYIELTNRLIDNFFASEKTESRYESIIDLQDKIDIGNYRFTLSHFSYKR